MSNLSAFFRALVVGGVACVFLGFAPAARAISVSPVLFDYSLNPGEVIQGRIRIANDTETAQTYYTSAQNFVPKGEEGQQTFLDEETPTGLTTWIALDAGVVTLQPGEAKDFSWAITVPKDAEPGGHYAAVFFSTQPPEEKTSVGVGAKTGVLFLVNVSGNVREALDVESFDVLGANQQPLAKSFPATDRLPVNFELRVRNTGSVHVQPEGTVTMTNMFGQTVGVISMNRLNGRALPGSIRRLSTTWGPEISSSNGGVLSSVSNEWQGFAIGRYTATLDGAYGRTGQTLHATTTFWVFPWRLMLIALVVLIGLAVLVRAYNRMVIRNALFKKKS